MSTLRRHCGHSAINMPSFFWKKRNIPVKIKEEFLNKKKKIKLVDLD